MSNQPNIMVVDKHQKTVVVIDIEVPSDSNIRQKEYVRLEKCQVLKEKVEKLWKVVLVVVGTLKAHSPK